MSDRDVTAGLADVEIVTFVGFVDGTESALFARTRARKPPYLIHVRVDDRGREVLGSNFRRGQLAVIDRSMGWVIRPPRASEVIAGRREADESFWFDVPRSSSILVVADSDSDARDGVPTYEQNIIDDDEIPF